MEAELDKPISFFRFEDLRIYHKALDYIAWVHEHAAKFYEKDKGMLSTRFCHAAQSIGLNIAEGSARNKSQFIYHLKMGKSSLRDCLVYTSLAFQLGYINEEAETYSRSQLMEMTKMLGALIGSLQKAGGIDEDND
jgi:four helix bundle protein